MKIKREPGMVVVYLLNPAPVGVVVGVGRDSNVYESKAILVYIVRSCLKYQSNNNKSINDCKLKCWFQKIY